MEYVPIRTSTLRGDQKIHFDVYIQLGPKYILYLRQGDSFEGTRLERLRQKKLKKMFIPPEHESAYRDYMTQNIESAYDQKSDRTLESRAEIIHGVQQSNVEAVMEEPENEENYKVAKEGAARYVDFLLSQDQAIKAMLANENADQDLAHHGVSVSTLAVSIAQNLGMKADSATQLLALGALLHDFGHGVMSTQLFKPIKEMDLAAATEYKRHPMAGAEKVRDKRHFDQSVINIISQHEELCDGSGYPQGLLEKVTDPLALIVSTANDFDRLAVSQSLNHSDALRKFTVERLGLHPLNHIQALKNIVK